MSWRVGVVGSPIAHSLSPRLHEVGLALAGLEGTSERVELSTNDHGELAALGATFDALSVTSPLKRSAVAICDELSDVARRTESVNSLRFRAGVVEGQSTDGAGFLAALRAQLSFEVADAHVVVLGAGGAASALVDAVVAAGAATVVVHARNEQRVQTLVERYSNVSSWSLVYRPVDLIVNATPGVGRHVEAAVLQGIHHDTVAVDITYEPRRSAWSELYEGAGCRSMNGLAMLAYQAALQLQWWFDTEVDGAKLLEALT